MVSSLITLVYVGLLTVGLVFAAWEFFLLFSYLRQKRAKPAAAPRPSEPVKEPERLPFVTVQIPLFNERFSAARVIEAAAALTYPRDRIEIQVLDDSSDETCAIVDLAVESVRRTGRRITAVRRPDRQGYKAGALAYGMTLAKGDLIAIFDADFVPDPGFLLKLIDEEQAFADPAVGFVQARWEHRNLDANLMTRAQAIMLDRFFLVANPVRQAKAFAIMFNGSGGIWRRRCVEDAGGWTTDTLTEDMDLSYRAALRGWKGRYFPGVAVPCDLPSDLSAFKRQQRRWARGGTQCLVKLLPGLVRGPWSPMRRLMEVATVAGYHSQALVLAMALLWPAFVFLVDPPWLFVATQILLAPLAWAAPISFFLAHEARGQSRVLPQVKDVAAAIGVSQGLSIAVTAAIIKGYFVSDAGEFERTPKGVPVGMRLTTYTVPPDWTVWAEGFAVLYCLGSFGWIANSGRLLWALPMLLWAASFALVFFLQTKDTDAQPERALSPSPTA